VESGGRDIAPLRRLYHLASFLHHKRSASDADFIRASYRLAFGVYPDLDHPLTLNEKIQWRKLYDRDPQYTECSDKRAVRQYVADRTAPEYLIPLLGVAPTPADIDFDSLPSRFALKANHGSGWNLIVTDTARFNRRRAIAIMNTWVRSSFYWRHREWQYKEIEPVLLIEALLSDGAQRPPTEYRFFCFDGVAEFVEVVAGRFAPPLTVDYYDKQWRHLPVVHDIHKNAGDAPPPANLREMTAVAEALARQMSFVRVDLYLSDGRICFGEMTFTPCAGLLKFHPPEYGRVFGDYWTIGPGKNSEPYR